MHFRIICGAATNPGRSWRYQRYGSDNEWRKSMNRIRYRTGGVMFVTCVIFALAALMPPAFGGGREVVGTISKIDPDERTFSVTDGMGVGWNYKVLPGADMNLSEFREGDRVSVSISRATPLNMMSSADYFRKGDKIEKIPY
jgi:hypothetical protein